MCRMYMSVVNGLSARCCGAADTEAVNRTHDVKTPAGKSNVLIRMEITEEKLQLKQIRLPMRSTRSRIRWHDDGIFPLQGYNFYISIRCQTERLGSERGRVWIPVWTKNMARHVHRTTFVRVLHCSPSCCQLALVLGRTDDTGLSRTYVPTNPGELRLSAGSHFTKRSCWWLVLRVCGDMQTDPLWAAQLGLHSSQKPEVWLHSLYYQVKHAKLNTIMIARQK